MSTVNYLKLDGTNNKYEAEILNQLQELDSMSNDSKKRLKEKLQKIQQQPSFDLEEQSIEEQSIADAIAGKTYSVEEKRNLELLNLMKSFAQRTQLLEDTINTTQVAELLACRSRQTPLDRVKNQTLIAVKDNGQWKYPLWQFDPEGADGVVQGLPETIQALQVSNLAKVSWLTRQNPIFNNLSPLEMLKRGEIQQVINEAVGLM